MHDPSSYKIETVGCVQQEVNEFDKVQKTYLGEFEDEMTEFQVTDGKNRDQADIDATRSLEELIGISKSNPFGTIDRDVFAENLADMTKTDLENLCGRVGIPVRSPSAQAMKTQLVKEFKSFCQHHGTTIPTQIRPTVDPSSPHYKEVVRLLED